MTSDGAFSSFVASGSAIAAGCFAQYGSFYIALGFAVTSGVFAVVLLFDLVTEVLKHSFRR